MGLREVLTRSPAERRRRLLGHGRQEIERDFPQMSVDAWLNMMGYNGLAYNVGGDGSLVQGKNEITDSYLGLAGGAYKGNGVIFACMRARAMLFSEARLQWRQMRSGRPGDLFGNQELQVLEKPWTNGTTGDLLARAMQDVDLEGNFYAYRNGDQLVRMRPDWVTIILGSTKDPENASWQVDAEVIGYGYQPGGLGKGQKMQVFLAEEVAHWAPLPDPDARFRGMTWLRPIMDEIQADSNATRHKEKFFEKGATPNMIVTLGAEYNKERFKEFMDRFQESNVGVQNAYKTLFLSMGSSAQVVGSTLQQMDFKVTQGAGETRIAAAAGVPPIVIGLSEGLASATYSNYSQAMRSFADLTMRPLWRNFCASMMPILTVPPGAELWYDDRDIAFLSQSQTDNAAIMSSNAATMHTLIAAGFKPDSVVQYIESAGDASYLEHTGLFSVQLQPAGALTLGKGSVVQGVPSMTSGDSGAGSQPGASATDQVNSILQLSGEARRLLLEPFAPRDREAITIGGD